MRVAALILIFMTFSAACAPGTSPGAGQPGQPSAQERGPSPTLVTVVRVEPASLASKPITGSGAGVSFVTRVFNAELDMVDGYDRPIPYLAEALPELNTDSWKVFPDGRMETTYRLKPDLTWHDGTPLTPDDFVFAHQVYKTPELGVSGSRPINMMEAIEAPDAGTLVIRWSTLFPDAGVLKNGFQPLPRHILEEPYRESLPDLFANHPYWTVEYVGAGPFRLERWEPGAWVEGTAFEGHVLGRPKIDRIEVRFMADENTVLANLLSENVHLATDRSIRFEHTQVMQREWAGNNRGVVLLTPSLLRYILIQFRPEAVQPPAMMDLRVRRAIAHAVDKQGLNEGVFEGQGLVSETFIHPDVPYFAELDRTITKYPYDPRRSEQLMNEAGFTKNRDGYFVSASGERFSPLFWEESGSQNQKELNIFIATWQQAGFDMQTFVLPAARLRDAEFRATFPAMYTTQGGGSIEERLDTFTAGTIPTSSNRYQGNNRGGWVGAEYDGLWQAFDRTLERSDRDRQVIQMMRILSEEVPAIPFYFNFAPMAHLATLTGPAPAARIPDARIHWNLHEWTWR